MIHLSQNKKIAFSAFGLFLVSFAMMALFLRNSGELGQGEANVLNAQESAIVHLTDDGKADYVKSIGATNDPLVVINAEGSVEYSNGAFCSMIAVKCEKFHNVLFFDFINSKDLSGFVSIHGKLLQTGEKIDGIGPFRLLKGKREIIVLFDAKPLLKDGKVFAVSLYAKDITNKVKELNKEKGATTENNQENQNSNWIENIYPNLKEIKDNMDIKLMVNKLG